MDDGGSPTNELQLNLQDFFHTNLQPKTNKAHLVCSPDENENRHNGSKHDALNSSEVTMGRVEQDSINNNEDNGEYTSCCQEDESDKPTRCFTADEMCITEKCFSETRSPGKPKGPSRQATQESDIRAAACIQDEDRNKQNANFPNKDPSHTLQGLFSLLQEEFEEMDSRVLPLCLHQIAETYFQNGEYEKAVKFIQLERLYHEQLLANLSSIQQQWEKKWKATSPSEPSVVETSAKDLNNEDLDKLVEFCTSHQEPLVFRSKLLSKGKSSRHIGFIDLMKSQELKEQDLAAYDSDTQTWPGIAPKKNQCNTKESRESFQPESFQTLKKRANLQLAVGKDSMEEEHYNAESMLTPPTPSTGKLGTPHSGCLSSRDASKDDSLQLREEQFSKDGAKIEAAAEQPAAECSSKPMVDTLILTDADYMPPDLISTDENVQSERNLLRSKHCSGSIVSSSSQLGSDIVDHQQQQPPCRNGRKSAQGRILEMGGNEHSESSLLEQDSVLCGEMQQETAVLEEECGNEESVDFFVHFLNVSLKEREESFTFLENQGGSEIRPPISPDEALYSSSEGYLLDESFTSLDELAKRIEIAETVRAEGLVSILKKRDDSEGKTGDQIQQRQSKRRVRFQEMEDTFDQEDVGGGSCILLVLLCIATVFISVGGTALYCTFADPGSPVCTDFAANMDFYWTRVLQGIEELNHWISFS